MKNEYEQYVLNNIRIDDVVRFSGQRHTKSYRQIIDIIPRTIYSPATFVSRKCRINRSNNFIQLDSMITDNTVDKLIEKVEIKDMKFVIINMKKEFKNGRKNITRHAGNA